MARNTGTLVSATVRTRSDLDTYPVVDDIDLLGGLRIVDTLVERNAIFAQRRRPGMICYVVETDIYYKLEDDLVTWSEDAFNGTMTSGKVKGGTNQVVLADGSWQKVLFETTDFIEGNITYGTSAFTAVVAGKYLIGAALQFDQSGSEAGDFLVKTQIRVNNVDVATTTYFYSSIGVHDPKVQVNTLEELPQNAVVEIYAAIQVIGASSVATFTLENTATNASTSRGTFMHIFGQATGLLPSGSGSGFQNLFFQEGPAPILPTEADEFSRHLLYLETGIDGLGDPVFEQYIWIPD